MFKEYNEGQDFLLPPSFKEYLGEGHESIILNEIINELNLDKLYSEYNKNLEGKGRPAYNPKMLLKIIFYGYMNQTFSSRKLANKLKSDLAFMYLSGNNQADFRTINRFRKEKGRILEDIFVQIVKKAKVLGLISFGTVSLDGTKIYANASKNKNSDLKSLEKKIKGLFEEAEEIDKLEDEEFGENNENDIPEELKTKEGRDKKRKEIEEKKKNIEEKIEFVKKEIEIKEKAGIKQDRINSIDIDSRLMQMKRKDWGNGYNPQNITENQIILSTRVPNTSNDINELIPSINKLEEQYNITPINILADKGYGSEEGYIFLEEKNISSYIPHQEQNGTDLREYKYDKEKDIYEDNNGNIYKFHQFTDRIDGTKKKGRPKKDELKNENDYKSKNYISILKDGTKKYLRVSKNKKQVYKNNDLRLYSEEGRKIYKKRAGDVEPVFGNIKRNLGFERFLLRGFEGVQIEWNLISLAHNLKKIIKFKAS